MKRSRFSEDQTIGILKGGSGVPDRRNLRADV